jgi:hypothetical protein
VPDRFIAKILSARDCLQNSGFVTSKHALRKRNKSFLFKNCHGFILYSVIIADKASVSWWFERIRRQEVAGWRERERGGAGLRAASSNSVAATLRRDSDSEHVQPRPMK